MKISEVKREFQLQQWRGMVLERKESGLSVEEWCSEVSVNPTPVLSVFRRCATISVSCLRVSATAWDSQRYGGYEHEQCVTGNEYGPDGG